ncbi:MAG: metallophosphoesterase [Clostridia bacterium]|nr:metallophosphoesterase [Clostridia bacterium]
MKQLKFYVMADPHFFDSALGCSGEEYEDFMHYEQKCFAETESINKSVFEFLKKADEADIVLIAGDLCFNGEKKSHEGFLKLLYELKDSGKKIYVVTADHDFKWKREDTFAFGENGRYSPEHTERDELFDMYKDFGFGDAIAEDKEHLSYVAQLSEDVRLMALNCDLKKDGKYYFFDEQLEWIEQQAKKAREDNQTIVAMCHYPILPGQPLFSLISPMLIRDAHKFATFLADNGIHIIFTGHMHNQSINELITKKGNKLYDITTGSIIADPAFLRLVSINDEKTVEIKSIPTPDFEWDTDDCKKYLSDMFDRMIVNVLTDMRDDTVRAMNKFHIKDKGIIKKVLRLAGKFICSVRIGTLARLLFIRCDESIKGMRLLDYATELVRGAFEGNQSFVEGTPKGDLWLSFLNRISFILKRIDIKSWDGEKADLYNILKNTAGNYGIDDYNATLIIK